MGKELRESLTAFADDMVANGNNVTVRDMLLSIMALHECHVTEGHPGIEIFDDGSLSILHPRTHKVVEQFHNTEEFVACMSMLIDNWEDE